MLTKIRQFGAPRSYCLLIGVFFLIRAASTLIGGPSFATPGTGWRAVFQLAAVVVLTIGVFRAGWAQGSAALVGAIYLLATVSELANRHVLLGAIPVDMRDRIVHPAVGIIALACVAADSRMTHKNEARLA